MNFDFTRVIERRQTGSLKWARYESNDILPMWVADMDFAAPPCVLEAIARRLAHGVLGYTVPPPGVTGSVVSYLSRRHTYQAALDEIVWLPGLVPAKSMACRAVGRPGEAVMTLTPVYPPFLMVHKDAEKRLITVPLKFDAVTNTDWTIDFQALEQAITPDTRVFLFCNPHNPVGRVYTHAEVQGVVDFCRRHQLLLVSDEIHCDLVLDEKVTPHVSALAFADQIKDQLIVLMAASKTYNIPGLGLAWAVIPDAGLRAKFRAGGGKLIPELNPLSYAATQAALEEGEPWRQELLQTLREHRARLEAVAASWPVTMTRPLEATYLAWFDMRPLGLAHPHAHFEKHGVGLSNGVDFAAPGWLRLNFGCPLATLEEGLARMQQAVAAAAK